MSRKPAVRAEVLAWFDPSVYVTEGFAGSSHHVRIGERDAELIVALDGAETVARQAPKHARRGPTFPEPPRARGNDSAYNSLEMMLQVPKDVFAMDAILLRFTDRALTVELKERTGGRILSAAIGEWMAIVRDWLAGWTNTLRALPFHSATPEIEAVLVDDPDAPPIRAGGRPSLVVMPIRPATPEQVCAAFAAASSCEPFPLQHTLLANARVHRESGGYREAVIDACSAAEVALSEVVRSTMRANGHRSKHIHDMTDKVHGVMDVYRMVATGRPPLEVSAGAVMTRLANPRNRAAHEGDLLDNESAMEAIKVSRALVELTPLLTPQQIQVRTSA